jgi:hypothetical protein
VEAVGGVSAEGFVGDQVQMVEVVQGLSQFVFVDAHGVADTVFTIPADALWIGDQTQKGVGGDIVWCHHCKPLLFVESCVEPTETLFFQAAHAVGFGHDNSWVCFVLLIYSHVRILCLDVCFFVYDVTFGRV